MSIPISRRAITASVAAVAVVTFGLLAGCTATPAATAGASGAADTAESAPLLMHIHGAMREPATGDLLLATHAGLFRQTGDSLRQVGPPIDLMGFAIGADGTFYASGHPGAGVDLPQPVGLITSKDSGQTWQAASRGGESDFHALTVGPDTVAGFDGALRVSEDRTAWTVHSIPAPPRTLAASPQTGTLLATTEAGLLRSADNATTWQTLAPPEPAVLVAWADEQTIAIATTAGRLATSGDAGATWTLGPKALGTIDTLSARRDNNGRVEIIVSIDGAVLQTTDAGASTDTLVP
ncbi:MAG: hypothetical protein BGO26_06265 [Actinobacteria bacterium 69-20]|nr:hypothetical protein [Actinomycetota bacterium]OJV28054.1 MAG: hypothetical protein BGO26_06265 [Actinobacteria bacterium 69-20]